MNQEYVSKQLKRTNLNLLLTSLLITAFSIVLLYLGGIKALLELSSASSKIQLWTVLFLDFGNIFFLLTSIVLLILSTVLLLKGIVRVLNIESHPLYKSISFYGQFNLISQEINSEVLNNVLIKYANIIITDNWFIQTMIFRTNIINLKDVIWAYRTVVSHEQGLLAPGIAVAPMEVAKSYGMAIYTKNPYLSTIRISIFHEKDLINNNINTEDEQRKISYISDIQNIITAKNQNVISVYSDDLMELWNKDKAEFIKNFSDL